MSAVSVGDPTPLCPAAVAAVLGEPPALPTSHVAIVGPGGSGKTTLVDQLSAAWAATAPGHVVRGPDAPRPGALDLRVVDDAHLLDAATLDRLTEEAAAGRLLLVAARPHPGSAALDRLLALAVAGTLVDLRPWSREDLARWGAGPDAAALERTTGGLPWVATAPGPTALAERYRQLAAALPPPALDALHGLAVGLVPDAGALEPDVADALWASGLVDTRGGLPEAVRPIVLGDVPQHRLRQLRRTLLDRLTGTTPPGTLLELAHSGPPDARLTAALTGAADRLLVGEPAAAAELYAAAGDAAAELGPRRAEAALRAGELAAATRHVEEVLATTPLPDPQRSLLVALAVLLRRGLADRAVDLCRWHAAELAGPTRDVAGFVLLVTGHPDEATALLARPASRAPGLADGVARQLAEGLVESLRPDPAGAVATVVRAAEAAAIATAPVLPDCPAAIAAVVALHAGEMAVAESVLRPALERSDPLVPRLRLLLGWTLLMRGDPAGAASELQRALAAGEPDTRDAYWAAALECALARRDDDPHRLRAAWAPARDALLRQPVDLLGLLPLAELQVAATRLGAGADVAAPLQAASDLLTRLGEPVLWTVPLHWAGIQAAILANRPPDVAPHARRLVAAADAHPLAATLAAAGRTWMRVLGDDVDPEEVLAAASALVRAGQPWEARRLLGHAAAHSPERRDSALLLDAARRLAEAGRVEDAPAPGAGLAALSAREIEVARLVVAGRTYLEIGRTLYLSARTVEHHVARVKRRIGAQNRQELLAQLRAILADA